MQTKVTRSAKSKYKTKKHEKRLLLLLSILICSVAHSQESITQAKELYLLDQSDKEYKLSELLKTNKYVLVDFRASWCGPCLAEIPFLKRAYTEYHDKGFGIFAVSYDSTVDAWEKYLQ